MTIGRRSWDGRSRRFVVLALLSGLGGSAAAGLFFLFLGMITGVIASCASAPQWWRSAFPIVAIVGMLVMGVRVAVRRWNRSPSP